MAVLKSGRRASPVGQTLFGVRTRRGVWSREKRPFGQGRAPARFYNFDLKSAYPNVLRISAVPSLPSFAIEGRFTPLKKLVLTIV